MGKDLYRITLQTIMIIIVCTMGMSINFTDGALPENYPYIDVGITHAHLDNATNSQFYRFNATEKSYSFSLNASILNDFDLYLYDTNMYPLDFSSKTFYPETIEYHSLSNQTLVIEVRNTDNSDGNYTLDIQETQSQVYSTGSISGVLSTKDDFQIYYLRPGKGLFNISLSNPGVDSYLSMKLLNSTYDAIFWGDGPASYTSKKDIIFYNENETNLFYLVIYSKYYASGSFTVYISSMALNSLSLGINQYTLQPDSIATFFMLDALIGYYNFTLDYYRYTSYFRPNLKLYDLNMNIIDSSFAPYYANDIQQINYFLSMNSSLLLYVGSEYGSNLEGFDFTLYYDRVLERPLPDGYRTKDENYNFDIFEIRNLNGDIVNITLEMIGYDFYFIVSDINLDVFVDEMSDYFDEYSESPHILANTDTPGYPNHGKQELLFDSTGFEILYVYVFRDIFYIGEENKLTSGYKLHCSHPFEITTTSTNYQSVLPFSQSGEVFKNENGKWDSGEFIIFKNYEVQAGNNLDVIIDAKNDSRYDLAYYVLLFKGDNQVDIENAISQWNSNQKESSDVFLLEYQQKDAIISYQAKSDMSIDIAIYTTLRGSPVNFDLYTNIQPSGIVITTAIIITFTNTKRDSHVGSSSIQAYVSFLVFVTIIKVQLDKKRKFN